ncbi:MAG: hypothetical protein JOZ75_07685, partial [Candidatus Dormibacteraeota bacterium]|nr:hypothetical protein [Candidatus Dormibacteraeota bacterium]
AYPHAVIADYLRHTPQSYWATATSLIWSSDAADALDPLGAYSEPALLLFSSEDRTISRESAAKWAALLPSAERRDSAGGHQLLLHTHFAPLADWLTRQRIDARLEESSPRGDAA